MTSAACLLHSVYGRSHPASEILKLPILKQMHSKKHKIHVLSSSKTLSSTYYVPPTLPETSVRVHLPLICIYLKDVLLMFSIYNVNSVMYDLELESKGNIFIYFIYVYVYRCVCVYVNKYVLI